MRAFRSYRETYIGRIGRGNLSNRGKSFLIRTAIGMAGMVHTDKVATDRDFEAAYQDIIDQNTPLFEKQTESLTTYQINFLRAIIDGNHSEFTTQEILHKYRLGSSANVSIIKRALIKKELIEIEKHQVVIPDPVMRV